MEDGDVTANLMDIAFDATAANSDLPDLAGGERSGSITGSPGTSSRRIKNATDPLDPALFTKTKVQLLRSEAAKVGWLSKEGHVVKNWKRRYFMLWPRAGSAWAAQHARTLCVPESRQLLLYYENEHAKGPRGIIALRRGEFQIGSESGAAYRGEDTLVLTVHMTESSARKRFILRSDVPGDPTDLIEWAQLMEAGTLGKIPKHTGVVQLEQPVTFVVHCPARQKAPGVVDMVMWRRSPSMDDKAELDVDGAAIFQGIADGSRVQGVAENAEWLQAENGYWLPKLLLRPEHHAVAAALQQDPATLLPEGMPPYQSNSSDNAQNGATEHTPTAVPAQLSLDDVQTVQQLLADGWRWPTEEEQAAPGTHRSRFS
eukprot:COSAG02_NODE_6305_length_3665_cov_126.598990_3_plen_372_part_00